jgi:uncharacterized protein (TIGR03083 family)
MLTPVFPISTAHLFLPLGGELQNVLRSLSPEEWQRPTACTGWSIQDVAAHLLGGSLGRIQDQRSTGPTGPALSFSELLAIIDRSNAEWVQAARRISPSLLIEFLAITDRRLSETFLSLPPDELATIGVAWAGEGRSANWFDIAREYTEKWLHQQHIREAAGRPLLTARAWLHPVLDTFIRALPYTYREVVAPAGTALLFEISGDAGGAWTLLRGPTAWQLYAGGAQTPTARVQMDADTAWRLFTKGLALDAARPQAEISGDAVLGEQILHMVSLMA